MMIQKYRISNEPGVYEAWPDVALTRSGKLLAVFSRCRHHLDRSMTQIMLIESTDRGRSWGRRRSLTESTAGLDYYYNCPRISVLSDGTIAVTVDRVRLGRGGHEPGAASVLIFFSADDGSSWSGPIATPLAGIVPDKLCELASGRWLISAHADGGGGRLCQYLHYSDDRGKSWSPRITVADEPGLQLCEGAFVELSPNVVVCLLRENSMRGEDCRRVISYDGGASWSRAAALPLPGCHRPTPGKLADGRCFVTYRFAQGGINEPGFGKRFQNFMAALIDRESLLACDRAHAWARLIPLDYDRSVNADLGYSGWVQFPDGEIFVVSYIVDDAVDFGQIRGYSLRPDDLELPASGR